MKFTRIVYRYSYAFKGELGPVRNSRAFPTEEEARSDAKDKELEERGYGIVMWREFQRKIGNRWKTDFDDERTQPIDP
jgi:hypothetical protein